MKAMKAMKKTGIATLLLLAAVAAASPASANWFFRPGAGVSLNIGSAPNPTPNDLRILYGPDRYSLYPTRVSIAVLRDMTGKSVYGENGEFLGMIATIVSIRLGGRIDDIRVSRGSLAGRAPTLH